jgi:hypothetical protein
MKPLVIVTFPLEKGIEFARVLLAFAKAGFLLALLCMLAYCLNLL